ncbi:uncharacterized protein TNCV_3106951 [Trichonephila clavipes]|nr:uncharacterized protein TNCV_3106951 [Trichonephila clavipes]
MLITVRYWGLVEHILAQLEPQVQDYVEIRNPSTRAQLLQVISKFEERYSSRETQDSRASYNRDRKNWDVRRMSTDECRNRNGRNVEVYDLQNNRREGYRDTYWNGLQKNQRNHGFENRNRFDRDNRGFDSNNGRYQSRNRGPSDNFN